VLSRFIHPKATSRPIPGDERNKVEERFKDLFSVQRNCRDEDIGRGDAEG